jgi:hypothetical protein
VNADEPGTVKSAKAVSAKVLPPSAAARSTKAKFDKLEKGKLESGMTVATSTSELCDRMVLHWKVAVLSV